MGGLKKKRKQKPRKKTIYAFVGSKEGREVRPPRDRGDRESSPEAYR